MDINSVIDLFAVLCVPFSARTEERIVVYFFTYIVFTSSTIQSHLRRPAECHETAATY